MTGTQLCRSVSGFWPFGEKYRVNWFGILVHSRQVRDGKLNLKPYCCRQSQLASIALDFFICGPNCVENSLLADNSGLSDFSGL